MMTDYIQRFAETLKMNDLPFPQETKGRQYIRVIRQVDEILISAAGLLLCRTGKKRTYYVKRENREKSRQTGGLWEEQGFHRDETLIMAFAVFVPN